MITEIVTFGIADGLTRETVFELYEKTAPAWRANPDLIRKTYLYDGAAGRGGGIYLWKTIEAAKRAHDSAWCDRAEAMYGSRPTFLYYETPLIIENGA